MIKDTNARRGFSLTEVISRDTEIFRWEQDELEENNYKEIVDDVDEKKKESFF
jgi:hypothetical protein